MTDFALETLPSGITLLRSRSFACSGVAHAFTTRAIRGTQEPLTFAGAASPEEMAASMRRLTQALGLDPRRFYRPKQVHGKTVLVIDEASDPDVIRATEADAVVTTCRGVTLAVATADCVPVLLYDAGGVVAAAHAGWRGILVGILEETVRAMAALGAAPERIRAAIGPAIGTDAFGVDEETAAHFAAYPGTVVRSAEQAQPHVNLALAAQRVLEGEGLAPTAIVHSNLCTFAREDLFFSYRREGEQAGRQLSLIRLRALTPAD